MGWVIQRKKSCRQLLQFFIGFSHAAADHRMPGHGKCHTFIFTQFEIALGVLVIFNEIFDQFLFVALG